MTVSTTEAHRLALAALEDDEYGNGYALQSASDSYANRTYLARARTREPELARWVSNVLAVSDDTSKDDYILIEVSPEEGEIWARVSASWFTPSQARDLAARLLKAADAAEGK